MEEVNINGKMENIMMENMIMIKNVDLVFFVGKMENNIKDIGLMGNNMEKELWLLKKVEKNMENG